MDTLALLCNLHADGPATLQKLRRVGCESLVTLLRMEALQLGRELDWSERQAERFLREAALLSRRVDDRPSVVPELEQDELEQDELEPESELAEQAAFEDAEEESEQEEPEPEPESEEPQPGFAPPYERVEAVLGAWRELDRVSPPKDPEDFEIPRPAKDQAADMRLGDVTLPGLTRELIARLAEHGIVSLRGLVAARDLELARTLHLGYTRFKHLQFLAARELASLPTPPLGEPPASVARAQSVLAPYPPPSAHFESAGPFETAGPFA